jgi:hypothetical protein
MGRRVTHPLTIEINFPTITKTGDMLRTGFDHCFPRSISMSEFQ